MTDRPPPRRSAPSLGAENAAAGARGSGRSHAAQPSEIEAQRAFFVTLGLSVVLSVGLGLVVVLLIHGPDEASLREIGPRAPSISVGVAPRILDPALGTPVSPDPPANPPAAAKAAETTVETMPAPAEETPAVPDLPAAGRRNASPPASARRPRARPVASPTISIPDAASQQPTEQPDAGGTPPASAPAAVEQPRPAPPEGAAPPAAPGSEFRN